MVDATTLGLESIDPYQIISQGLGISTGTVLIILAIIAVWTIIWKGFALWKSAGNKKVIWFIPLLIVNDLGLLSIFYIFIFSKIKDNKSFKRIHDSVLILSILSLALAAKYIAFLLPAIFLFLIFSVSIIQIACDKKNWTWMILGILLMPIVPMIYYFAKLRTGQQSASKKPVKKKR